MEGVIMDCEKVVDILLMGYAPMALAIGYLSRELYKVRKDQLDNLWRALEKAQQLSRGVDR